MTLMVQIYNNADRDLLLASYGGDDLRPATGGGGLTFSTNQHGFAGCSAPLLPMRTVDAFKARGWAGTPHVVISDETDVIWEGRLEDRAVVGSGLQLGAFGYYRALLDVPYTALWSDSSTKRWEVVASAASFTPERYSIDFNNRLYIAPRSGESIDNTHQAAVGYRVPDGGDRDIVEIEYTYSFLAPNSTWQLLVHRADADFASAVLESTVTGTGSVATATVTLTLAAAAQSVVFTMKYNSGTATSVTDTGDVYLKITGIRVKTKTGTILASDIAAALTVYVNGINPQQLDGGALLITDSADDLHDELYEDIYPVEILSDLALRHGYDVAVWENQQLMFAPSPSTGSPSTGSGGAFFIDVTRIVTFASSLEPLKNSAYGVYQDADGRTLRTAVADDANSIARYGLTRRASVKGQTTSGTQAGIYRDAFLADSSTFAIRAEVEFSRLYDAAGAEYPLYALRANSRLTLQNLPPTLDNEIDAIRSFLVKFSEYSAADDAMRVEPSSPVPTLVTLMAQK